LTSERTEALGDPEAPLSAAVMGYKFHGKAYPLCSGGT
jgi:hypothetical protein